ncbi:N-acetylmuramidase domain-containing protein [Consotaella salsifontis]|uniref:Putative peptidoglycan binding domain-containing protein n=1 Tax=Consotaella salsifontis TaxID=1365950 RepID=A0A1T4SRZ9_9HYPH|nr:N-acetylmuramidase domain-containing protein [Consotaella salsifontis]SKA30943.1 Putative peptidoglycan binding domain-containing protein [Consotaella salsifontis]
MITTDFRGAAKRLDDIDLPRIAATIGVGEDELHAVLDVETGGGSGFDAKGRPRMLFEPHVFYRELSDAERARAVTAGLAYRTWGERPYPSDSYPRLIGAMAINRAAALRSASWGLGQIMGFNASLAGFASVDALVSAFMADEEAHLAAMVSFITASGLDDELRRHDWTGFARGYNGAGYAKNRYHLKLASAFAKWQGIRDTSWSPADAAEDASAVDKSTVALHRGSRGEDVRALQSDLATVGSYTGKIDGDFGPATEAAVVAFQKIAGILPDGWAGDETIDAIKAALVAKPATVDDRISDLERRVSALEAAQPPHHLTTEGFSCCAFSLRPSPHCA